MNRTDAMLVVDGLNVHLGRAHILCDVRLHLNPGEVVVVLGRNGAGKSTTLKSIMGLHAPSSGEITFLGERIDGRPAFEIARCGIGYVPEERRIFSGLTVLENLEVGRLPARPGIPAWTPDLLFELFPNLAAARHRVAAHMSGGEQQMLTIARTLMGNPRCILLDEPSEGLAPLVVSQIADVVRRMKAQGLGVLLSEQNLRFATSVADRACIIEKGWVRFEGRVAELNANEAVRTAYLAV